LLYKKERDNYIKYWADINPFVKYGCIREDSFYDRVKDIIIFKTTNDNYVTLSEYLENNKEKHENTVYYVSDIKQQVQYMVKIMLNLESIPKPDDAADALAIAVCHGNSYFSGLTKGGEVL